MLEIANISKDYVLKEESVHALKNVSVKFRRSEFVSILGPSGCGKTTLLNIIGGLDRYTSGDLIIDGVSTKNYKDKDWDNYRNHKIGFVFQTYNLIPHQTVLENVELALTISGISKKERYARAVEVLTKVGLADKLKAKPNQLSGGQMQRVAIARALVNDPEIILADEPTGALDSKTSLQIMDLLKEVSEDRLVIMVTHNAELAEQYSSRIIRLLDGELVSDSKPYTKEEKQKKKEKSTTFKKTEKKKSMSFWTALNLSLKNMFTKKGRTIMVSFAGSIGIIGIALILAVSAGMTGYINDMQSESLASYPVSVSTISVDYKSAQERLGEGYETGEKQDDSISVYDPQDTFIKMGRFNYMNSDFVEYVKDYYSYEKNSNKLNAMNISYASDMRLITENSGIYFPINSTISSSAIYGSTSSLFFEGIDEDYVRSIYDIKGGENAHYPSNKNEVALVVSDGALSNSECMQLGISYDSEAGEVKYEDLIGKTYELILNDAYYNIETEQPNYQFTYTNETELMSIQSGLGELYKDENTITLTISCVLEQKEGATGSIFSNGIMYTQELKEFYHNNCVNSQLVKNVRAKYLDENKNFSDTAQFVNPYTLRISELSMVGLNENTFTYTSPLAMQTLLSKEPLNMNLTDEQIIELYLQTYGASSIPTGIYFYTNSFDAKDDLEALIQDYNKTATFKITLTDSSELFTSIMANLVDVISYVLVAFASISLVVSSVMIGIITYTSVIERTKEIGVLRSIGASKRDVSRVFNAETVIIGFSAGVIGILISLLLTIPINLILKSLTGVANLAIVEWLDSLILIVISVVLTFIAGLIPARIASKKDPVKSLRAE